MNPNPDVWHFYFECNKIVWLKPIKKGISYPRPEGRGNTKAFEYVYIKQNPEGPNTENKT
jgi:hypothetical protein